MSDWTYSGNPSSTPRDEVRFLIGDTDVTDQQLKDKEIDYLLTSHGSPRSAAIAAATGLIAKYSRLADERVGAVAISYSQRAKAYRDLVRDLKIGAAVSSALAYCGGISQTDKEADETDDDRIDPVFEKTLHNDTGSTT